MNEFFRQVGQDGKRVWGQMTMAQRLMVGAVGAATIGLLIFLVVWAQQPNYEVLFSKLSDQDAGAIVAKLKDKNVPFQLDGMNIKVPAANVNEVRLELAGAGLPSGGTVGFSELFNGNNWGATDFTNRLNYQRGLEGELSRTISSINGVQKARVHIVIPKESLFIEDAQATTASVLMTLAPGTSLEVGQIKAIQHLVSKAVPKLKEEAVYVTDTTGRDYTEEMAKNDPKNIQGTDLTSRQLDMKRKFEHQKEREIQTQLDEVLGAGNSVVRVNTAWDWSNVETNKETYTPSTTDQAGNLKLSEKFKNETYAGSMGANANGGVPGANPNVAPDTMVVEPNQNGGNYENHEGTVNYVPNHETQRLIKEPAVLKDLTVSVAYNQTVTPPGAAATAPANAVNDRTTQIKQMVGYAAGIAKADLDNKVVVTAMAFNNEADTRANRDAADAARNALWTKWGTVIAAVLCAAVAFFLLMSSFRRRRDEEEIEEALPRLPEGDLGITLMDDDSEMLGGVERMGDLPPPSADEQRLNDITRELTAFIRAQPKDAVKLVRAWMTEDE